VRVAFSPDGRRLAAASVRPYDRRGEVRVWDTAAGKEAVTLESNDVGAEALAVSPDGRYLAANAGSVIKLWDLAGGRLVRTLVGH
jgi:WD40 repeat protein